MDFLKLLIGSFEAQKTRKQFYLLQAKNDKAKDIIKIISPLESFPSQSIATLLESNRDSKSASTTTTYNNFVGYVLEEGADPILPTITIHGNIKKGSEQSNIETTEPTAYLTLGPPCIFKEDKLVGYATTKESELINLIQNKIKEIKFSLTFKNDALSIDSYNLKTKLSIEDESHITLTITGNVTFITSIQISISVIQKKLKKLKIYGINPYKNR